MANFNSSYSGAQIENSIRIGKELSEIGSGNIPKLVNGAVENAVPGADFGLPNLTGSTNPTGSTVGIVGQIYVNTQNGKTYVCTNATASTYTWELVSGEGGVSYAECTSAASAAYKNIPLTGITLESGKVIAVRFTNGNTAHSISLVVNGSVLKAVLGTVPNLSADAVMLFVYNGANWLRHDWDDTYTGYVSKTNSTASSKGANGYARISANQLFPISFLNANTYEGLVRLALGLYNGDIYGTYPVYINGAVSSVTNFDIPRGSYIAFFDGANVYINTDGTIPNVPNATDLAEKIDKATQASKTAEMTVPVGIDANGKLWSIPGSGGGGGDMYKVTYDPDNAVADAGGIAAYVEDHGGGGTSDYTQLTNKPKINDVELSGNKTASDLGFADVATSGSYNDLDDTPTIPTVPTALSDFTDDLGSSPVHTHSQYLTEHQDISNLATKTEVDAKYTKPSGGIPKTDLASAVQTSLGLADSALQSHQDISGKENISNKVTSMSASSTDTQYPSAKAVYDELASQSSQIASTKDMLSDAWTQRTYAVGEYAIYNNKLWKCLVANSSAPSEGSNWTEVTIASEFYNSIIITQLTLVRTENAFCTVEDFARLKVYEKNGFYYLRCNLQLLSGNATSFVEIGRIQNYSSASDILISIPSQLANGNVITLQVTANGVITIYGNITQKAFFRAAILSIKNK